MTLREFAAAVWEWTESKGFFCLGIGVSLFLLLGRIPGQWFTPSLFLEDGTIYYHYAFEHGWLDALLAQHLGYYAFWPNVVSLVAAKWVPIEQAPYVILLGALAMWLLVGAMILMPGSPFITNRSKVLALVLTALTPPLYGRLTLNFAHFFACAASALVLVSQARSRREAWVQRGVLLFSGLTGPVVLFLIPVFMLAWKQEKSRGRFWQVAILCGCALLQLLAFYHSLSDPFLQQGAYALKARNKDLGDFDIMIFWMFCRSLVHPFLGDVYLQSFGQYLETLVNFKTGEYWLALLTCSAAILVWLLLIDGVEADNIQRQNGRRLMLAFIVVAVMSFITGLPHPMHPEKTAFLYMGHRYFIVCNMLMVWAFILHAASARRCYARFLYREITLLALTLGMFMWFCQTTPELTYFPDWKQEVALWRQNHSYQLHIMPNGARMALGVAHSN